MSEPKDGGPAFPHDFHGAYTDAGMTLRDHFAAAALTGLLAQTTEDGLAQLIRNHGEQGAMNAIGAGAFKVADIMLAERAEGQTK